MTFSVADVDRMTDGEVEAEFLKEGLTSRPGAGFWRDEMMHRRVMRAERRMLVLSRRSRS